MKSEAELPRSINPVLYAILEAAVTDPNLKNGFRAADVRSRFNDEEMVRRVDKELWQAKQPSKAFIIEKPKGFYTLTERGLITAKARDQLVKSRNINPDAPTRGPARAKKKKAPASQVQMDLPPPNFSSSADQLANTVAQVLEENSQYRKALVDVAQMIASKVGMKLVEIESEHQS